ncbi:MAG: GntR family transcriptional regulator [Bacillus sp. (in: firmicutes)]
MENNVKTLSKKQFVYNYLRTHILNGTFGSGQRIIIDQVAKDLGTSPIPVREAIRQLESDGLITYKPYSGAVVTSIDEAEYMNTLSVLSILEGYATALSSSHLKEGDFEKLANLNKLMKQALEDFELELFGKLNKEFHAYIIDKCGNPVLIRQIADAQNGMDRVRKSIFPIVPKRAVQSIEEHEEIIRLLQEQAAFEEIESMVREHKFNTITAFLERQDKNK